MTIYSSGQTVFSFSHIEGITMDAGEEVDEVDGRASGMDVDFVSGCASKNDHGGRWY